MKSTKIETDINKFVTALNINCWWLLLLPCALVFNAGCCIWNPAACPELHYAW